MKKVAFFTVLAIMMASFILVGCVQEDPKEPDPPEPVVLEWIDVVPGDYWRPVYFRAYAEGGLARTAEEPEPEPTIADFLNAYCQYWGPISTAGEGEVVAFFDGDQDGVLYPWEAIYDFTYLFDGTILKIADWDAPFTVKNITADGWTMRLNVADAVDLSFLADQGLEGMAWIELDFENCGIEPGDAVDECLDIPADFTTPDEDQWDVIGDALHTENNVGWITTMGSFSEAPVGGSIGLVMSYDFYFDSYDDSKNGTPEYNKHLITLGDYEFWVKPQTDRVLINPGGSNYSVAIVKGGVTLGQTMVPGTYSSVRKWLDAEIFLSEYGVGFRAEIVDGTWASVLVPGEDASGAYSSFDLTHRTGTDENVNDYQGAFKEFCVESVPVQEDCGCD